MKGVIKMAKHRVEVKINTEVKVPKPVGNSVNWRYTFVGRLFYATNGIHKLQIRVKRDCALLVNLEGGRSWVIEEKRPSDKVYLELWKAGLTKKFELGLVKDTGLAEKYKMAGRYLNTDWFYFKGKEAPIQSEYYGYFNEDVLGLVPDKNYLIPIGDLKVFSNKSLTIILEDETPPWEINTSWKTVGFALSPYPDLEEVEDLLYEWVKEVRPHHLIKDNKYRNI